MKKIIATTMVMLMLMIMIMIMMQTVSAATMYSLDGRTIDVNDSEIEAYRRVNWFYGRPVTMYALDGRTLTIGENDVEMYRRVGWFYGRPVTMYAPDGRTLTIGENDVEMYRAVGWYPYPLNRMSVNIDVLNAIGLTYRTLENKYGSINQAFNDAGAAYYKIGNRDFWGAFYNRETSYVYVVGDPYGVNYKGNYGYVTPPDYSVCVSVECLASDLFNNLKGGCTLNKIYRETGMWFDNTGISLMDDNYMITAECNSFSIYISSPDKTVDPSDLVYIRAYDYNTVSSIGMTY